MTGLGHAVARLGLDKEQYEKGLASAKASADQFAKGLSSSMRGLGAAIAGAFAFDRVLAGLNSAIQKGDQLQDLANRFQLSASALQEIGNTASLSGSSLEDVASALSKLAKNAGDAVGGNEKLQQSFAMIGLSLEDLQKMSPQDMFFALSDAVSQGRLGMEDFNVVTDLAGRSAGNLIETLRLGPDAIRDTGQSMGVWGDETTAALSRAQDSITAFQNKLTIMIGNAMPALNSLLERFQDLGEAVGMGLAERTVPMDEAALAAVQEQKASKVADILFGRSKTQQDAARRPASPRTLGRSTADAPLTPSEIKAAAEQSSAQDAARKRAMDEFQMGIDERNEQTRRDSGKWLKDALEKLEIDAKMVELNAERTNLQGMEKELLNDIKDVQKQVSGQSLLSTRSGRLALTGAEKQQQERKRQDDFRFEQENNQKALDDLRDQANSASYEAKQIQETLRRKDTYRPEPGSEADRLQRELDDLKRSGLIDPYSLDPKNFSGRDAEKRRAQAEAQRANPTNREQAKSMEEAITEKLEAVRELLDENLTEMRTYSHAR